MDRQVGWMDRCMDRQIEAYFKELPHAIVGTDSSKSEEQVSRLHIQAGVDAAVLRQNSFFPGKPLCLL